MNNSSDNTVIPISNDTPKKRFGYYQRDYNLLDKSFIDKSSNGQIDKTEFVDPDIYNPKLIIRPIIYNQKTYNVIRDDYLVGGTKQRGMIPYLESSRSKEFVYAGPTNGYAQVALAYAAYLTGRKATLIVNKEKFMHAFTRKAYDYGAKIIPIPNGHLHKIQNKAADYVKHRPDAEVVPFGGYTPQFVDLMHKNIELALPDDLRELINTGGPTRMWLVGGSATLLNVLYKVFPHTEFMVIQIGKKIWDDQLDLSRTTKYVAAEQFQEPAMIMPPYPSVSTYDAKLWIFATQYGKNGDYIWNVAAD